MSARRVMVTGGRDYRDREAVELEILASRPSLIIVGCSHGADAIARSLAYQRAIPCAVFRAPWDTLGPSAGPRRNGWMVEHGKPDLVLAFPGGKGTADAVRQARAAGVEVREVPN